MVARKLTQLNRVRELRELAIPSGNRLEALRGARRGQHRIRINDQYRICFRWEECTVIPLAHVDHFTDVEDGTAERIMRVAQRIGRRMREVFQPQRVGMVVHGYGVAHAHLILVPQHGPYDITSARFAQVENGQVVFTVRHIATPERRVLDEHAGLLSGADAENVIDKKSL